MASQRIKVTLKVMKGHGSAPIKSTKVLKG